MPPLPQPISSKSHSTVSTHITLPPFSKLPLGLLVLEHSTQPYKPGLGRCSTPNPCCSRWPPSRTPTLITPKYSPLSGQSQRLAQSLPKGGFLKTSGQRTQRTSEPDPRPGHGPMATPIHIQALAPISQVLLSVGISGASSRSCPDSAYTDLLHKFPALNCCSPLGNGQSLRSTGDRRAEEAWSK